jgi:hypothetical protein
MKRKARAATAREQGFPEAYLGENGNFRPGYDARAKTDLVHAVLGLPNPDALHRFTRRKAQRLIDARGWQKFVVIKQRTLR